MAFAVAGKIAAVVTAAVLAKVGYDNREWIEEQILKLVKWVKSTLGLQPVSVVLASDLSEDEEKLRAASEDLDNRGYEELMCPISHKLLLDPVITPYKHCFDRESIEAWLRRNGTCPITRQPLSVKDLKPCAPMRLAVEQFIRLREELKKDQ